ncbi:hypothetical protein, partial [Siphonobacter sp. BAB-5385]|uniref:hypothetical protein n=1 Tax=Siphonobacter sp. BAB-5385 TaxID=1864822 RepID=UPI001C3D4D50
KHGFDSRTDYQHWQRALSNQGSFFSFFPAMLIETALSFDVSYLLANSRTSGDTISPASIIKAAYGLSHP